MVPELNPHIDCQTLMLVQWALGSSRFRAMPVLKWLKCVGSSWMMDALMHLTDPHILLNLIKRLWDIISQLWLFLVTL